MSNKNIKPETPEVEENEEYHLVDGELVGAGDFLAWCWPTFASAILIWFVGIPLTHRWLDVRTMTPELSFGFTIYWFLVAGCSIGCIARIVWYYFDKRKRRALLNVFLLLFLWGVVAFILGFTILNIHFRNHVDARRAREAAAAQVQPAAQPATEPAAETAAPDAPTAAEGDPAQ